MLALNAELGLDARHILFRLSNGNLSGDGANYHFELGLSYWHRPKNETYCIFGFYLTIMHLLTIPKNKSKYSRISV